MVLSPISVKTPDAGIAREPGGYLVSHERITLEAVSGGKFHQIEQGQALLITERNPDLNFRNPWKFKLLTDKSLVYLVTGANYFIYITPSQKLAGKSFCITGELTYVRPTYISLIQLSGGSYRTAMSGKVDYLVTNKNRNGTKAKKAKALGTKIISELELLELLYRP